MGLTLKVMQLAYLLAAVWLVCGDVYMHNPRGSNNRLNERSANRNNANRLFDSQNNNRGGYNAGDTDDNTNFDTEEEIYYMKYFQSGINEGQDSLLQIEWTNQHGCGGNEENDPHKLNCNIVLQYFMPQTFSTQEVTDARRYTALRNGVNTGTQGYGNPPRETESEANFESRRANNVNVNRGLHETFEYYDDCTSRDRNRGLFTADQRLRGTSAKYTRQNPNGNRRGYECPEERDYFPYWHPTPWRDIAILTDNVSHCEFYQSESFNVKPRQYCRQNFPGTTDPRHWSKYNNQADCENPPDEGVNPGTWYTEYAYIDIATGVNEEGCRNLNTTLTRGYSTVWYFANFGENNRQCLILPPAPECIQAPWSRVNHLGNGRDGVPLNYTWTIPYFMNDAKLTAVRIRYNISTDDYHPWQTNASFNANPARGRRSPIEQNPNVDIGLSNNKPLRLAINTAQFGRTFQDRSHAIVLRPRSLLPNVQDQGCLLHNLNVRGKRGNIVQTYPAVEYDFIPNRLEISENDCVHIQWTGSNTHNNGAPGGDGQTGDAGEGRGGTDRHNIIEVPEPNSNYPCLTDKPCGTGTSRLFRDASIVYAYNGQTGMTGANLELTMLSGGYYQCLQPTAGCDSSVATNTTQMNQLLNNVSPSFEGFVLKFRPGTYHYICSRNNNFTNRSQKGMLTVRSSSK